MIEVIRDSRPVAKKDYDCDACHYLLDNHGIQGNGFRIADLRLIVKAKRNGYRILKGQKYVYQVNKMAGDFYIYRAIPEIHDFCLKNEIYDND